MKVRAAFVTLLVLLTGAEARAQAPYESFAVQTVVQYVRLGWTVVACGDRPSAWAESIERQAREVVSAHAGDPLDGEHLPSEAEKAVALRAIDRSRDAGTRDASPGTCRGARMGLANLDDFSDGAVSMWMGQ